MNILDAHKIIYDYIDTASSKKGKFLEASTLKNSVEEIEDAWKLYFAHIIIFKNWESPEWLEIAETLISMLPYFYYDFFIEDYNRKEAELNKYKNSIFSVLYKSKIKEAKESLTFCSKCMADYSQRFIQDRGEYGIYTGMKDSYRQAILDISGSYDPNQFNIKSKSGFLEYLGHIAKICVQVYQSANMSVCQSDIDLFLPFPLLPIVLKQFNIDKNGNEIITGYYKNYILTELHR